VPPPDRLSALDGAFLDLETPAAPLHVGWTMRLGGEAPSLSALRRHLDARLDALPRFRRRVVGTPLGLGGRQWIDDPGFDIARHVHAVRVKAPGGPEQLREVAGTLLSQPLDPRRPLWRLYLVDGLSHRGFAVVGQAHHALVDGIAAVEVAMLLFDAEPDAGPPPPSTWVPSPAPSAAGVARATAGEGVITAVGGSRAAAAGLLNRRAAALRDAGAALESLARPAPATALDRTAGRERLVAFAETSFAAVREAGRRHGATVNDVLLAASTLALGRALRRRGEHPATLKALVPVNTRADGSRALGNRISFLAVDLPVARTDPREALRALAAQTRVRKAAGEARALDVIARSADLLPPVARRLVARSAVRTAPFNAVVSNVPGPPGTLYLLGRPLQAVFPSVPILHGHGLAIGAISYRERLQVGILADAQVTPDAVDIARDLEAAFDALRAAPVRPQTVPTPWRARARARRDQRAASR